MCKLFVVFILPRLRHNSRKPEVKMKERLVNFIVAGLIAAILIYPLLEALNFSVMWLGEFPEKWSKPLISSLGAPAGALCLSIITLMLMMLMIVIALGVMAAVIFPFVNFFVASEGFPWRKMKAGKSVSVDGYNARLERDTWIWWPDILRARIRARAIS